jgi:hypothetical protein
LLAALRTTTVVLVLCASAGALASPLPQHLGDTGLYADRTLTRVAPDLLTYTPQYPLWSDGATKRRWIRVPPGTFIDARDADAWVFPVGTRVWKEFSRGRRRETRLIVRTRSGWVYGTYRWAEDGTDALLVAAEGAVDPDPGWPSGSYVFPSQQDCRSCHEGRPTPLLGFSALQLSPGRDPFAVHGESRDPGSIDLGELIDRKLIRGLPVWWRTQPPRIYAPTPDGRAVLGYLHGNCGQCHNARGPLASVGLDLWVDPARPDGGTLQVIDSLLGASHFRIPGVAPSDSKRLVPGAPDLSAILVRMRTRERVAQMPPIATQVVDTEAVQRVEQWIWELGPHPTR